MLSFSRDRIFLRSSTRDLCVQNFLALLIERALKRIELLSGLRGHITFLIFSLSFKQRVLVYRILKVQKV